MRHKLLIFVLFLVIIAFSEKLQLYKGQLHCHSTQSDGTYDPDTVASRYKSAGYDFISLTDHNMFTDISHWNSDSFLTIAGDEITSGPNHVNAFDFRSVPVVSVGLQGNVNAAIIANSSFIQVNHPYSSGHTHQSLLQTTGYSHLELSNTKHPGPQGYSEEIWDTLLTNGRVIWGTAADDFHYDFTNKFNRNWIEVFAAGLSKTEVIRAIRSGDFFACKGASLVNRIDRSGDTLTVFAKSRYNIRFYGMGGILLKESVDEFAQCLTLGGQYVRVEVSDDIGNVTYIQPFYPHLYNPKVDKLFYTESPNSGEPLLVEISFGNSTDSVSLFLDDSLLCTMSASERVYSISEYNKNKVTELSARFLNADGNYYWSKKYKIGDNTSNLFDSKKEEFGTYFSYNHSTNFLKLHNDEGVSHSIMVYSVDGKLLIRKNDSCDGVSLAQMGAGIFLIKLQSADVGSRVFHFLKN